jgi:hypothetical protein
MTKHCHHRLGSTLETDLLDFEDRVIVRTTRQCMTCGEWLGMGESDETPVAAEVRAAELSDLASSHADSMESSGWGAWDYDSNPVADERWHTGWLGRVIFEHGRGRAFPDDAPAVIREVREQCGESGVKL